MHIFISGIGGAGLSSLAHLCLDLGYKVSGSDPNRGRNIQKLQDRGVKFYQTQDPKTLENCHNKTHIDYYIFTPALENNHPEKTTAQNLGILSGKQNFLINKIITEKSLKLVAVAGTHGKTTTTAIMTWVFKQLQIPISYIIGTEISFGNSGQYQSGSQYLIYEADEYNKKFLDLKPELSIITNIDYDHPDTYPTQNDYYKAFTDFITQTKKACFCFQEDVEQKIQQKIQNKLEQIIFIDKNEINPEIKLSGVHNRQNAQLVFEAVFDLFSQLQQPKSTNYTINSTINSTFKSKLLEHINSFPGTDRRFEKLRTNIYSDYAHHPTEIQATLELATEFIQKNYPGKKLVVVYQPHQNTRQYQLQNQYTDCFNQASEIYWLPTFLSRENPNLPILSGIELTKDAEYVEKVCFTDLNDRFFDKIIDLAENSDNNSFVLLLGAGDIDPWFRLKLKQKFNIF